MGWPTRVICLTEETTETLYRIGAGDLIVGVSGFTVRPPEARKKPRVSSFLDANFERILELKPDLVLGFSDLQAELGAELCRRGVQVHLFNQRSVEEVLQATLLTCAMVGRAEDGQRLCAELRAGLDRVRDEVSRLPRRPRAFFEEWHEPLISGIRWCSELLELAGAVDVCVETRAHHGAKGRIFAPEEVAKRDPEVVVASWCGRKARREKIVARPGWAAVTAVRDDQLYEVRSPVILQPGPAALTEGLAQLQRIVAAVVRGEKLPPARAGELRSAAPG
ncbi:MAG: cobalamin-binding protein [Myxococcaceae bacterium]|nr:cobalamin-binding protein [Myxococcaceae bacterium]